MLGYMPTPKDFKYADVLKHGKPVHEQCDIFAIKHPSMPPSKRAKIFSPFDALRGFSEAVEEKDELYVERAELSEDECEELNKTVAGLCELVHSGSAARENNVTVTVTHFVPCGCTDSGAYGNRGQYTKTTGVVSSIDPTVRRTITVDGKRIHFEDIVRIVYGDEYEI